MNKEYDIALIPGDGIGPEVTDQAVKALEAVGQVFGLSFRLSHFPLGGERYLACGQTLDEETFAEIRDHDDILLGAIGHPDVPPGVLEQEILLRLRFDLDLYANLRPIKLYPGVACPISGKGPKEVDLVIVRENTEGLYVGAGGRLFGGSDREIAIQESINTYSGIARCLNYAFELARAASPSRLTMVAKTNVMSYASGLWQRVFEELGPAHPEVEQNYAHADAAAMWLVKSPESFKIMVTDNLFGDILSDLGAMIAGGLGLAAGGNISPGKVSMFEPIGGSAPKYTGQNVANPLAAILAAKMMLDHLGLAEPGRAMEEAATETILTMAGMDAGKMGCTTEEVGDRVRDRILKKG